MSSTEVTEPAAEPPAAAPANAAVGAVGAATNADLLRTWVQRVRHGESGMLPVLVGLVIIVVIFQSKDGHFLTAGNITNLLIQSVTYVLLGMAEVFVLLLAEIDLSLGYLSGIGAVVAVALTAPDSGWPWWAACIVGILVTAGIGAIQGVLITRLRIPSFVVTLAGLLGLEGLLIYLCNREGGQNGGGVVSVADKTISNLVYGNIPPVAGWIAMIVLVVLYGASVLLRDRRLRASGLTAPPRVLAYAKITLVAAAGVGLVLICNADRGTASQAVRGVPWAIPIVLALVAIFSFVMMRTKFGRYVYAIGGNPEGARRAGINLARIRLLCFTLAGLIAGVAGILYASRLGSVSNNIDGGQLVLYAVAAAVIGGTSLTGGRGKMVHALLGGLIVATIYNGMGLIGLTADAQDMVIALVLLAAVTVDAVSRRSSSSA